MLACQQSICQRFERDGLDSSALLKKLQESGIEFVDFDEDQALQVAQLQLLTRELGLSLADRACIALGITRNQHVLTADRVWLTAKVNVKILCIR